MNSYSNRATAHAPPASDFYTDDDVVLKNSPLLKARTEVKIQPSPSSSLDLDEESPPRGSRKSRRLDNKANPGDAVLVSFLATDGRHQETANLAGILPLPSDTSEGPESHGSDDSGNESARSSQGSKDHRRSRQRPPSSAAATGEPKRSMSIDDCPPAEPAAVPLDELQSLATSALGALGFGGHREEAADGAGKAPANLDMVALDRPKVLPERGGRRDGPAPLRNLDKEREREGDEDRERDDRNSVPSATSPYSPRSTSAYSHSPLQPPSLSPMYPVALRSPTAMPRNPELPPIQDIMSPRPEPNGPQNPLPSFRDTFSSLSFRESPDGRRHSTSYPPHSPPGSLPRLAGLTVGSPPVSPNEVYRRGDLPSPATHLSAATSPYYAHHPQANGFPRHSVDYSSSSATETPGSTGDYATPAGSGAGSDRLVADGLATTAGTFVCKFPGCVSMPFHTQYLLNSHMNVHSSARPHYCPVKGCPRAEGGKGFKRKNEMIRHGLVHDSPGYICPFCPDREHKYPRPDNLQRHVRVHHVDKDKDDPLLRDVLAQRPDGPNRGRRRRHGPG